MDDHDIGKLIAQIYRKIFSLATEQLVEFDIDIRGGQLHFLRLIHHHEGISQEELSNKLGVDKATTAKAVKKLVTQGYVEREKSPDDKRRYQLMLTPKAKDEIPQFKQIFEKTSSQLTKDFSIEEKLALVNLLERAFKNLEDELGNTQRNPCDTLVD